MGAWGTGIFDNDDALDWLGHATDPKAELHRLAERLRRIIGVPEEGT